MLLDAPDEVLAARAPARGDEYSAKMEARLAASKEYLPIVLATFEGSGAAVRVVKVDVLRNQIDLDIVTTEIQKEDDNSNLPVAVSDA